MEWRLRSAPCTQPFFDLLIRLNQAGDLDVIVHGSAPTNHGIALHDDMLTPEFGSLVLLGVRPEVEVVSSAVGFEPYLGGIVSQDSC